MEKILKAARHEAWAECSIVELANDVALGIKGKGAMTSTPAATRLTAACRKLSETRQYWRQDWPRD